MCTTADWAGGILNSNLPQLKAQVRRSAARAQLQSSTRRKKKPTLWRQNLPLIQTCIFSKKPINATGQLPPGKATIEVWLRIGMLVPKRAPYLICTHPHDTHVIPFLVHFRLSAADAHLISLELERKMHLQDVYNNSASILQPERSSQEKVKNTGWPGTHMENEPTWPSHTMKKEHPTTLNFQMQISKRTNGTVIHYHISGSPPHFQFNPFLHSDGHLCDFWCFDYQHDRLRSLYYRRLFDVQQSARDRSGVPKALRLVEHLSNVSGFGMNMDDLAFKAANRIQFPVTKPKQNARGSTRKFVFFFLFGVGVQRD